jgi:hypothetical protein
MAMSEATLGQRYRLEVAIGRGGMATVWRATDLKLDRPVAIKRLHSARVDDSEFAARFRREAQLVGGLSHPNIVRLLDGGEDEEGPYLVLELVQGETLKDKVSRQGALAPGEASRLVAQVADALGYAHAEGIVHRDVKSQNVLIDKDGVARLTDFGIARMADVDTQAGLTAADVMLGSADYLAPEQAQGGKIDGRTDVYSLGVVLYECVTGQLPFTGDGFVAVAMQHVSRDVPDPRRVNPDCPAFLAATVARACAKEASQRFASAKQMAAALREEGGNTAQMPVPLADDDGGTTAEVKRRRRGIWRAIGWGVLVTLVVGAIAVAGVYVYDQQTGSSGTDEPTLATPLALAGISDFDPEGEGRERPSDVPNAADGDPESVWFTERYATADFGNLKDGVGLLLSAADGSQINELVIESPTPGASFQVLGQAGASGVRPVLANGTTAGGEQTIPLGGDGGDEVVLWFTGLTEDDSGRFWAGVGQVELRGASNSTG